MSLLLQAASAGLAHICLGPDRMLALFVLGALQRGAGRSLGAATSWAWGHFSGLLVVISHILPVEQGIKDWGNYASGVLLACFGLQIFLFQHLGDKHRDAWQESGAYDSDNFKPRIRRSVIKGQPRHLMWSADEHSMGRIGTWPTWLAAAVLGGFQGLLCSEFVLAAGLLREPDVSILAIGAHGAICMVSFGSAAIACACVLAYGAWNITMSLATSIAQLRKIHRCIGFCCCFMGVSWVILVGQQDLEMSAIAHGGNSMSIQCPTLFDIDGVSIRSAPSWEAMTQLDTWWTVERMEQHRLKDLQQSRYRIARSHRGGCGVFTSEEMPAGMEIDVAGVLRTAWDLTPVFVHVTPWFGIAVNHCNRSNAELHNRHGLLYLVTTRLVRKDEEIVFDYDQASRRFPIQHAEQWWTC